MRVRMKARVGVTEVGGCLFTFKNYMWVESIENAQRRVGVFVVVVWHNVKLVLILFFNFYKKNNKPFSFRLTPTLTLTLIPTLTFAFFFRIPQIRFLIK